MRSPLQRTPPRNLVDPHAIVAGLFSSVLGREATGTERETYAAFLIGGGSSHDVVAQLLASPECQVTFFRNSTFRPLVAPDPLPGDTERLYVWHLPKTAGTSLREMLKRHFPPLEVCDGLTLSELLRLSPARLHSYRLIVGHLGPMLPPLLADVPLVTATLLREPIALIPSSYCQWRDHGVPGHLYTELAQTLSFDDWCRRDETLSQWSNPQARALALPRSAPAWPGPSESPEGRRVDTGVIDVGRLRTMAMACLDGIDIAGMTEDLPGVYRTCIDRLGLTPLDVPAARENVGRGLGTPMSEDTRSWLLTHNTVDVELVAQVRDRRHQLHPV